MRKKIKSTLIQLLCAVIVLGGIITIDQTNRAEARAKREQAEATITDIVPKKAAGQGELISSAGISRAITPKVSPAKDGKRQNAKKTEKKHKSANHKKGKAETTEIISEVNPDDLYILAHVIDGEGRGEDEAFKWLVGAVVLNRVEADVWPNTIKDVVFQPGQYACTWDKNYNRDPEDSSWIIAEHLLRYGITEEEIPHTVTGQSAVKQGKVWLTYYCDSGLTCYFCHNRWIK